MCCVLCAVWRGLLWMDGHISPGSKTDKNKPRKKKTNSSHQIVQGTKTYRKWRAASGATKYSFSTDVLMFPDDAREAIARHNVKCERSGGHNHRLHGMTDHRPVMCTMEVESVAQRKRAQPPKFNLKRVEEHTSFSIEKQDKTEVLNGG